MICNFYNQTKSRLPFNLQLVKKIINKTAKELKLKNKLEIAVLLVSDKQIKSLNKKFRHQDQVTDVLSFSQKEGEKIILPKKETEYLGDIFICYPQVKRQAKKFGWSIKKEFALLLIHGFLHLLGFQDKTKTGFLKMVKIQDKILSEIYD